MQAEKIDPVYDQFDELQLESARQYPAEQRGRDAVEQYIASARRLCSVARITCWMEAGRIWSLAWTAQNCCRTRPQLKSRDDVAWPLGDHASLADGKFWFAAEGSGAASHIWTFLPYYFLVLGATGILCWIAAAGVISPIRRIANSIALFGQGNLSVRVETDRPMRSDNWGVRSTKWRSGWSG